MWWAKRAGARLAAAASGGLACTLQASGGPEQLAIGSPAPPLEERVGERRFLTILDAAVCGDVPAGCRTNRSGVLAENDDLLSLALSSKGGEGNGAGARGLAASFGAKRVAAGVFVAFMVLHPPRRRRARKTVVRSRRAVRHADTLLRRGVLRVCRGGYGNPSRLLLCFQTSQEHDLLPFKHPYSPAASLLADGMLDRE
jgi:hypothetical protein